jgi:hypothetical protein
VAGIEVRSDGDLASRLLSNRTLRVRSAVDSSSVVTAERDNEVELVVVAISDTSLVVSPGEPSLTTAGPFSSRQLRLTET